VQPKLAARVRLAGAGDTNKTGPDDARPVAVAALRSRGRQEVTADGQAVVLKVRARRHRDLSRTRNQVVCRCCPGSSSSARPNASITWGLAAILRPCSS
jgi:transposase